MATDYLEQADLCCQQAREAAGLRRFRSACGLYATALTLLEYALGLGDKLEQPVYQQYEERLRQIKQEWAVYELLHVSHIRSLL